MLIRISTRPNLREVVVTLAPTQGVKQEPRGDKYVWSLDPDEAARVGRALLKASDTIAKPFTDAAE